MLRFTLLVLLAGFISACSFGSGPAPEDHFYRIPEIVLSPQAESQYNNIVIKPVKSSGLYHERAILYIKKDRPLELLRYHYSFWTTPPAEIVYGALYQGLLSSGIATHISRELTDSRPDYIIDSRIVRFERLVGADGISVVVALEVSLLNGRDAGSHWTKRYEISHELEATDMYSTINAFGVVLKVISEQLVNDLLLKK